MISRCQEIVWWRPIAKCYLTSGGEGVRGVRGVRGEIERERRWAETVVRMDTSLTWRFLEGKGRWNLCGTRTCMDPTELNTDRKDRSLHYYIIMHLFNMGGKIPNMVTQKMSGKSFREIPVVVIETLTLLKLTASRDPSWEKQAPLQCREW